MLWVLTVGPAVPRWMRPMRRFMLRRMSCSAAAHDGQSTDGESAACCYWLIGKLISSLTWQLLLLTWQLNVAAQLIMRFNEMVLVMRS